MRLGWKGNVLDEQWIRLEQIRTITVKLTGERVRT
jgi:hypothetical protein